MSHENNAMQNVRGDGAPMVVSADELTQLKSELTVISSQSGVFMQQRQSDGLTRFAIWYGQSADGRQHASDRGRPATLFEGQPDAQVFLCDTAVATKQSQLFLAATRAQLSVESAGTADEYFGLKVEALHEWIKKQWGVLAYQNEIRRAANYFLDGLPAGVVWFCGWKREQALRMKRITLPEAADFLVSQYFMNPTPADAQMLAFMLNDPASTDDLAALLQAALPGDLARSTVLNLVRELRETGEAMFPEEYECANIPVMLAMEPWADVFWPVNTVRDIQNARVVYLREWLTAAQVHERKLQHGWSDEFVDGLIGKPDEQSAMTGGGQAGKSGLPIPWGTIYQAQTPINQQQGLYRDFRHLYEVVTAFTRGVNEFGVPGIYVTEFSMFLEEAAGEKRLYSSGHGKMPFVYAQKELVNLCLTDSRGITSMGTSAQNLLKMYDDLHGAAAQLSTLPPVMADMRTQDDDLTLAPLALNREARPNSTRLLDFPAPNANKDAQRSVERRFNKRHGLSDAENDANEVVALTQAEIDVFLGGLCQAWTFVMQDAQMFLRPEQVQEILGSVPQEFGVEDQLSIEGQFNFTMAFDALELNSDKLLELTNVVLKQLLPADVEQTLTRSKAIRWILSKWSPSLARACAVPVETANAREMADEDKALSMMLSGVSVPMREKGQNHALRLQRLKERALLPNVQQRLMALPDSARMVNDRLAFLEQQVTQERNKLVGRLGVAPDAMQQQAAAEQDGSTG